MKKDFEEWAEEICRIIWTRCLDKDETSADKDVKFVLEALTQAYQDGFGEGERHIGADPLAADPMKWFCDHCRPIAVEVGRQAKINGVNEGLNRALKAIEDINKQMFKRVIGRNEYFEAIRALKQTSGKDAK